jgi:hypothetical protein
MESADAVGVRASGGEMTEPDLTVVPESSRLRVITAGDVGNVQSRLGVSGFDVVAVVETEAELVVAVGGGEPDAIVVEADLCDSLEHVRELAPDATLIVVGDHTPEGALGHIDRGVSGTVLAGLLHALAAGNMTAAIAVPGFFLAKAASAPPVPPVRGVRQAVTAGIVGAVIVAGVALGLVMARSPSEERANPVPASPPSAVVSPVAAPAVEPTEAPSRPKEPERSPAVDAAEAPDQPAAPPPPTQTPSPEPSQPPADEPATSVRPPGRAHGWDHRPPKDHDHGLHKGWVKGHGPKT